MMRLSHLLFFGAGALAAPTSIVKRDFQWLELCNDDLLRNQTVWGADRGGSMSRALVLMATGPNDYHSSSNLTIPEWFAHVGEANFEWWCDITHCDIKSGKKDECKEDLTNAKIMLVLESYINLYSFIRSFHNSITGQRGYIQGKTASLETTYGFEGKGNTPWDKNIGIMAAMAGAVGALVPSFAVPAAGFGLVGAIDTRFLPEADQEKKFGTFSELSATFADNVQVVLEHIDGYLDEQVMVPYTGSATDLAIMLTADDSFPELIRDGVWAGLTAPPIIKQTNDSIATSLVSPIINTIWTTVPIFILKLNGPDWKKNAGRHSKGRDMCAGDVTFFEDLQPEGKNCDPDGSVYLIAHWMPSIARNPVKTFRNVPGLDRLGEWNLTRHHVIHGLITNHLDGGYGYIPPRDTMAQRIKDISRDDPMLDYGYLGAWNLPFCGVAPRGRDAGTIEEEILTSSLKCVDQHDQNGNPFPLPRPPKVGPPPWAPITDDAGDA